MPEKNKKKKYPGISAIFWIVFALILLILFLVNKNRIFSVLQTTGFFSKVFGTEPEFIANLPSDDSNKPVAELESLQEKTTVEIETEQSPLILNAISGNGASNSTKQEQSVAAGKDQQNSSTATAISSTTESATASINKEAVTSTDTTKQETESLNNTSVNSGKTTSSVSETPIPAATSQMQQHLFFIEIDGDGSVLRKETVRSIPKTTTPLTAAITALLAGPNLNEIEKGYISLIPQGTKLLGASVKNGTATINFSDSFRYNQYGVEGYYGQLMQIVFTATAFSNIDNVQFLIEGEKMDYLGLEGVYIGAPLSIASFH